MFSQKFVQCKLIRPIPISINMEAAAAAVTLAVAAVRHVQQQPNKRSRERRQAGSSQIKKQTFALNRTTVGMLHKRWKDGRGKNWKNRKNVLFILDKYWLASIVWATFCNLARMHLSDVRCWPVQWCSSFVKFLIHVRLHCSFVKRRDFCSCLGCSLGKPLQPIQVTMLELFSQGSVGAQVHGPIYQEVACTHRQGRVGREIFQGMQECLPFNAADYRLLNIIRQPMSVVLDQAESLEQTATHLLMTLSPFSLVI